ncbi:hypothetical protein QC761_0091280 [Podospora bellae-mahoneyi]|uniref:Uncharacterized protein n=1 Tax=Podospora bellae-mahoneyi TaxID=2093777 RepID=A0ABR0F9J4_9PEZI|nr:hypothetical protein QC761_0091280 [Podospora bellae-mahoneyi]
MTSTSSISDSLISAGNKGLVSPLACQKRPIRTASPEAFCLITNPRSSTWSGFSTVFLARKPSRRRTTRFTAPRKRTYPLPFSSIPVSTTFPIHSGRRSSPLGPTRGIKVISSKTLPSKPAHDHVGAKYSLVCGRSLGVSVNHKSSSSSLSSHIPQRFFHDVSLSIS